MSIGKEMSGGTSAPPSSPPPREVPEHSSSNFGVGAQTRTGNLPHKILIPVFRYPIPCQTLAELAMVLGGSRVERGKCERW